MVEITKIEAVEDGYFVPLTPTLIESLGWREGDILELNEKPRSISPSKIDRTATAEKEAPPSSQA